MPSESQKQLTTRRLRILWIVMAALLLLSAAPLWLYHRQVLSLSEDKLQDTERVQQNQITRSLASETLQFQQNIREQLLSQRQVLALTGWIEDVNDPAHTPQMSRLLQSFIENNPNILYVTAVDRQAKGQSAGSFAADQDPFVGAALKRAFTSSIQGFDSISEPFALGRDNHPALVMSVPLLSDGQFAGMFAAVVSLDKLQSRLRDASVRDRVVYIVNAHGQIVAYPDTRDMVPGRNVASTSPLAKQVAALPQDLRATQTTNFQLPGADKRHPIEMIGTYSTIPELRWAVIAQRSLDDARIDAGVAELTNEALRFVVGVMFASLLIGYIFAVGITRPIRGLVESTRAISRAEFHERVEVRGAAEISELAETFNSMAGHIEQYVDQLKAAAEQNRELFLGSIRMLAAAIDEKDPYTRGHSGRVAKYSIILGDGLGLSAEDLDRLRIAALLHDVGKIGVDDRVLKKPGKLTDEEFELMKQHTVKGANIMRPVSQLKDMLPGIELHHERMDGQGYPYGLQGDQIPIMARIIAVADTFDAITTNRPYQSAMDLEYALERIRSLSVTRFDPKVVEALESAIHGGRLRLTASLVEV
ncbi:MAG TPA: HD domain-containing phosphohydrolase [Candidatus Acidoferrales bacterium]|jgi:HD-GYP domain-containing protein (c-di-GMP phosphodiesterase class II)|nr:HD domain-containing phosphohydrolase [Candidatus Acidoferrales bacterium]